ncbi:MAG: DUF4402 domain-containing protein [Bacteroidetes bacterium]|nr:DUF4402 domain-containing protein [Bacteroidota bacterium]
MGKLFSDKWASVRKYGRTLCLFASILFPAAIASAQEGKSVASPPIAVQANLVQGLSVTPSAGSDGLGNLNLGVAAQSTRASNVNPNSSPSAGLMTINGEPTMNVTITYTPSVQLVHNGQGGSSINFVPNVVGATGLTMQQAASPLPSGSSLTLGSQGHFYFWLGGSVYVPPGQAPGTYTGVFNITIGY